MIWCIFPLTNLFLRMQCFYGSSAALPWCFHLVSEDAARIAVTKVGKINETPKPCAPFPLFFNVYVNLAESACQASDIRARKCDNTDSPNKNDNCDRFHNQPQHYYLNNQ